MQEMSPVRSELEPEYTAEEGTMDEPAHPSEQRQAAERRIANPFREIFAPHHQIHKGFSMMPLLVNNCRVVFEGTPGRGRSRRGSRFCFLVCNSRSNFVLERGDECESNFIALFGVKRLGHIWLVIKES